MNGFLSVFRRELRSYFSTPLAYVFLVIFLLASSWITFQNNFFETRQASLLVFFDSMPLLFIFLVPALAMRLWAEERRTNSIELLFTLPVTAVQAVLAKFFACWAVLALALALTCPIVITVCYLGEPDPGPLVTGYLGSLLLAGAYLAIGSFFSCLTRNQVIAFVLGVVACALFLYAGSPHAMNFLAQLRLPTALLEAVESLSLQSRFESFERGVIELRDVAFFVLLGAGSLWANVVALKERMASG
jgi:ABC-2 type transport system permease protein